MKQQTLQTVSALAWGTLDSRLLWVYEGHPPPQRNQEFARSHLAAAWLILQGQAKVTAGKRSVVGKAGDWLMPTPGDRLQMLSPRFRLLSVRFQATWPSGQHLFEPSPGIRFRSQDYPQLEASARQLLRWIRRLFTQDVPLPMNQIMAMEALERLPPLDLMQLQKGFADWLFLFMQAMMKEGIQPTLPSVDDPRLVRAIDIIHHWLPTTKFNETAVASAAGMSITHLNRLFRQRLGQSPHAYYQQRRIRHVCTRLQETEMPLKEIAYELGFASASHFSRWFRKRIGMEPRVFRQQKLSKHHL